MIFITVFVHASHAQWSAESADSADSAESSRTAVSIVTVYSDSAPVFMRGSCQKILFHALITVSSLFFSAIRNHLLAPPRGT